MQWCATKSHKMGKNGWNQKRAVTAAERKNMPITNLLKSLFVKKLTSVDSIHEWL